MSDEIKPESNETSEPTQIVMTITLSPDGSVKVVGPISQKLLAYGLLEAARDLIHEHHIALAMSNTPKKNGGGLISHLRGMR